MKSQVFTSCGTLNMLFSFHVKFYNKTFMDLLGTDELRIFLRKKLLHHLASAIRLNAQTTKMYRKEIVDLERLMTWDTR